MSRPALRKQALHPFLFFLDVVFDFFLQHLDLGVVIFVARAAVHDFGDQHLGAIVLNVAFLKQILVDLALAGGIENLFLDLRMDRQLEADFLGQRLLAPVAARFLELGEQFFDGAVVGLEQRDRIL
jgi:hypothetical protein